MDSTLPTAVQQAVADAAEQLAALGLRGPGRAYASSMAFPPSPDHRRVLAAVETRRGEMREIGEVLDRLYDRVSQAEADEAQANPLGHIWWIRRRRLLGRARGLEHERLWLRTWAEAFAEQRYDICAKVAAIRPPEGGTYEFVKRLRTAATAAAGGDLRPTASTVTALLESPVRSALGPLVVARLGVVVARIHLREPGDLDAAAQAAELAGEAAEQAGPDAVVRAAAEAVQGELALARSDPAGADEIFRKLISARPGLPDGYVGAGLVAAENRDWSAADLAYDTAVRYGGRAVVEPPLLRPVPPNLRWRYARGIRKQDPEYALQVLDEALALGIKGEGRHPHRAALLDRARILEHLGRDTEAAAARHEAGSYFVDAGDARRALTCFARARQLDPRTAVYQWDYADLERVNGVQPDGRVDAEAMRRAWTAVTAGFELAAAAPAPPWALITAAMIASRLPEPPVSPILLAERALLLDRDYARGYGYLAILLREAGCSADALAAAEQGYALDPRDAQVIESYATVLLDRAMPDRAFRAMDDYERTVSRNAGLTVLRSNALLIAHQPEAVRELVHSAPTGDEDIDDALLGMADLLAGDDEPARRRFDSIWRRRTATSNQYLSAYAAWLAGRSGDALEIFDRFEGDEWSLTRMYAFGAGLARLTRGDREAGLARLLAAIGQETQADDLRYLIEVDLPILRRQAAGARYEQAVAGAAAEAEEAARGRIREILAATLEADSDTGRLARARTRRQAGDPDPAIRIYGELIGRLPEVSVALATAVASATGEADRRLSAEGDLEAAQAAWAHLEKAARPLPADSPETVALRARLALAEQERSAMNSPELAAAVLAAAGDRGPAALRGALDLFVRDVDSYWAHRDALSNLSAGTVPTHLLPVLKSLADGLDLSAVCRMRRGDVEESAVFPLLSPVEVRLGRELTGLAGGLGAYLVRMRDRMRAETGVPVPAVQIGVGRAADPASVEFCLVEQVLDAGRPEPGDRAPGRFGEWLTERLAAALRPSLARVLGVDDVLLWLGGWTPPGGAAGPAPLRDVLDVRLRLVRVLRLLLREGISIADRTAIVAGFAAAEATGRTDPLSALREVRRRLGPALTGAAGQAAAEPLPAALQERLGTGRTADPAVWQVPRTAGEALAADLASWHSARSAGSRAPVAAVVDDPLLRVVAWRLFAANRLPVTVLSTEEYRLVATSEEVRP